MLTLTFLERICETDQALLLKNRPGSPAHHLVDLLEGFGLTVRAARLPGIQLGRLDMRHGAVLYDPWKQSAAEANVTLAHELGHWRLHRNLLELGQKLSPYQESQADTYAKVFLVPWCRLFQEWGVLEVLRCQRTGIVPPEALVLPAVDAIAARFVVPHGLARERLERVLSAQPASKRLAA